MDGKVEAICTGARRGIPKTPVDHARLLEGHGLAGDAHAGSGHRQVSILARADVQTVADRRGSLPSPGAFGENLILSGLDLGTLGLGSRLSVGPEAVLRISQIGKCCHEPCCVRRQDEDCIMPQSGLFASVEDGGPVAAGDPVRVLSTVEPSTFQAVVLTVSDRCSAGLAQDTAGPAVAKLVREALPAHIYAAEVIPDGRAGVAERLRAYADGRGIDLIVAVGGTGLGPRDETPEAVRDVVQRLTPGFDEAMRGASAASTPFAMLSRACSGIRGSTLIVSLPGSERAALENLHAILPALPHGLAKLRGDPADCGRRAP